MSSYKVQNNFAKRKSIVKFQTGRLRGSIVTISTTTLFSINRVFILSLSSLFFASMICLGPSLFVDRLAWTETSENNITQKWWMELNFDYDVSKVEPEPMMEPEPETEPEPERQQLPEQPKEPEPEEPEPEEPEPEEPEPEEPEPDNGLGRDSNTVEPEPEGEPDFDGNIYIRGPLEGIPTIGSKFALFDFDYSNLTVASVLRCLYPTIVATILGLTGLALERKGFGSSSKKERFDNIAFRISRRRLLLFAYKKMQMQQIEKETGKKKDVPDMLPSKHEHEWISTLFQEEASRYRRIVMKRRFRLRGVYCLHDRISTTFFYCIVISLLSLVTFLSYTVRSSEFVRRNIVLYCILLPLTEVSLVPAIRKVTLRCHVKNISQKWYYQSTTIHHPEYNTFLTKFRTIAVNCCIFPVILCWNPLSAWTLSHPMDPDNKSNMMKEYMQRFIFSSSEIFIYVWSSPLTAQSIALVKAIRDYYKEPGSTTIGIVGCHNELPVNLWNTCYVIFLACYVSILTSNPFVFIVAAIAMAVDHALFLLRMKMKVAKHNIGVDEVRIPNTTMLTQNAWGLFAWVFVPCLQVFSSFFLLPFNPLGNAIVFLVNSLASCAFLTLIRRRWPSVMKRKRLLL